MQNLNDVRAWLRTFGAGQQVSVAPTMFSADMIAALFDLLPGQQSLDILVTSVSADNASIAGTATVFAEADVGVGLVFSEGASGLQLQLVLSPPPDVRWRLLDALNLAFGELQLTLRPDGDLKVLRLDLVTTVYAGPQDEWRLPVELVVPSLEADWHLTGSFDSADSTGSTGSTDPTASTASIGSFSHDALTALLGNNSPLSILPADAFDLSALKLKRFEAAFNPTAATCALLRAVLSYAPGWSFFDGAFTIESIDFEFTAFHPFEPLDDDGRDSRAFQAIASSQLKIDDVTVDVGLLFPDALVFARLAPGSGLRVRRIFEFFHVAAPAGFPEIEIGELGFEFSVVERAFSFDLAIDKPVPILGQVTLDSFAFHMAASHSAADGHVTAAGELVTRLTIGSSTISLSGSYAETGIAVSGEALDVPVGELLRTLATEFGVHDVPQAITSLTLKRLKADIDTGSKHFGFVCEGMTKIADVEVDFHPEIDLAWKTASGDTAGGTFSGTFGGTLVLKAPTRDLTFDVAFGSAPGDTWIRASFRASGPGLKVGEIAAALGWTDMPTLPGDLDPAMTEVAFGYDFTAGDLVLVAGSTQYGQLVFASTVAAAGRVFLLDLTLPLDVKLSALPVVGPHIPASVDVGIQELTVAYASADYPAEAMTRLDSALQSLKGKALEYRSLEAGMVLATRLHLGDEAQTLALPLGIPRRPPQRVADRAAIPSDVGGALGEAPGGAPGEAPGDAPGDAPSGPPTSGQPAPVDPLPPPSPGGKTFDIGRTFGPLSIRAIHIEYADGRVTFALDANIAFGPVALSLQGLGVGSPLAAFSPVFSLNGLGVAYTNPPLELLGALLRVPDSQLAPGVAFQFDGVLVLKAEDFTIAVLGSYAQLPAGLASLFVFARLGAPLGGPPAFFVTALMGGFGFNRLLAVPGQDEVASFPLLLLAAPAPPGAAGPQNPTAILEVLEGAKPLNGVTKAWLTPKAGEYWLAAGLEFTSFKLVDTRALLIAEFGRELTIALLGLSTLRLPQADISSQTYFYAELMIRAVVQPAQGSFAATAILSGNSYVLTPDCHLTGGFAFCIWFGENPDAGQFVVTLGGYHPAFPKPDSFPQIPRLGFNWPVSNAVSIKGSAYFALTNSCAMAGGSLEVLYQDGDLRAWFTAQADFLVSWHPLFFTAQIAVSIGVSYRLNLLLCHKTVTATLGAALSLWGPPTNGVVRVDLVVVSFSVRFGTGGAEATAEPLKWDDLAKLLPATRDVCGIAITDGLFKTQDSTQSSSGKLWIVRAGHLAFRTRSVIPASEVVYADRTVVQSDTAPQGIAIKPMNLVAVKSTHRLSIYQGASTTPIDVSDWSLEPLSQAMPASLWSAPPVPFSHIPAKPSADVLPDELCGFSVTAPAPRQGASRGPVSTELLMEEYLSPAGQSPLSGAAPRSPHYLPTASPQTIGLLHQVDSGSARQGRAALFQVLTGAAMPDGSALFAGVDGDLAVLADGAAHLFSDPPLRQN